MVAADALGPENVLGITMPSRYSSGGSVDDSAELARNLGIEFWEIPIEPAHEAFTGMLEEQFAGTEPNVAEENVQARIRGNVLMTVSNKFGWIVLTTGNKSEMAMGYATLYGDMAGGFAVLKDVHKVTVYALSRWRNDHGAKFGSNDGVIPLAIIDKPPSAELREGQLDEDSLPPYEILDPVIQAYVEDDSQLRRDGGDGPRPRRGAPGDRRRGPQRIQAPPGAPRGQDHAPRLRPRPPPTHRQPLPPGVTGALGYSKCLLALPVNCEPGPGRRIEPLTDVPPAISHRNSGTVSRS